VEERDNQGLGPLVSLHIENGTKLFLAPRERSEDQRSVLKDLMEREADLRGKAAFALGYWAGFRVSDDSWPRVEHTHITGKAGWVTVGQKGGKERTINLLNEARRALADSLAEETRKLRERAQIN